MNEHHYFNFKRGILLFQFWTHHRFMHALGGVSRKNLIFFRTSQQSPKKTPFKTLKKVQRVKQFDL